MEGLEVGQQPKARKRGGEESAQIKPGLSVQAPLRFETIGQFAFRAHDSFWYPTDSVRTRTDAVSCGRRHSAAVATDRACVGSCVAVLEARRRSEIQGCEGA